MSEDKRVKVKIDKNKETRTREISKMISEGGLGSEGYYNVKKVDKEDDGKGE